MNMNIEFYYLRKNLGDHNTKKGHPVGVVAIRNNGDGTVNRGVAICSVKDNFNKKIGRGLAFQRLKLAEKMEKSIGEFNTYAGEPDKCNATSEFDYFSIYKYKSGYRMPEMPNEHRMFFKPS